MNYAWQNVYLCICNTYLTFSLLLFSVHIKRMRRRKVKIFSIADLWHIIERLWGLKCSVSAKRKQNDWLWTGREENDRQVSALWQYGLWSFQTGGTKLERFLPKNQHNQRKLLNFENWCIGKVSKSAKIWLSKSIFIQIFLNFITY